MNRKLIAALAILLAALAGIFWAKRDHPDQAHDLVLHGNIDIRQVELAFNASGRIDQLLVEEGEPVRPGQLLARLDTRRQQLALAEAKAQAGALRSQSAKLKSGSRPEEIRQAEALRDAAKVAVEDARQIYRRQQDLVARHFVSQQQADSAKFNLDAAQQRLQAAEESYRLAVLGPRKEDRAAADATLAAQNAAIAVLEHDIAEGELKAPDNGIVENRILQPGDMASPQKPVLTLALTDPVWARVYLPENALGRVPMGAVATIVGDSHPDHPYRAWIGYISPTAEFTPKTVETPELRTSLVYQMRVFACDGKDELRQGMPVTVSIAYDQKPKGVPCSAK